MANPYRSMRFPDLERRRDRLVADLAALGRIAFYQERMHSDQVIDLCDVQRSLTADLADVRAELRRHADTIRPIVDAPSQTQIAS